MNQFEALPTYGMLTQQQWVFLAIFVLCMWAFVIILASEER